MIQHLDDTHDQVLAASLPAIIDNWINGEEGGASIGEGDIEEEESLNEDYKPDQEKDEVIDTNTEGSEHPVPQHGLVEEGPGPDA